MFAINGICEWHQFYYGFGAVLSMKVVNEGDLTYCSIYVSVFFIICFLLLLSLLTHCNVSFVYSLCFEL